MLQMFCKLLIHLIIQNNPPRRYMNSAQYRSTYAVKYAGQMYENKKTAGI